MTRREAKRRGGMRRRGAAAAALLLPAVVQAQTASAPTAEGASPPPPSVTVLPQVDVVAASPLLDTGLDRNKVPSQARVLTGAEVVRTGIPTTLGALDEQIGSVAIDDAQGNPFQPNLLYRGFTVSPLDGTPQGLAVYLNGVRFNQPFGDTVNWDLLPEVAVDRLNLESSNPVFGLNALGGALSIRLKNGFTYHGGEASLWGGSFGTVAGSLQYGAQSGSTAAYIGAEMRHVDGWRQYSSSEVRRVFADIGWRGERAEVHLGLLAADNLLNGPGTTPVEWLAVDRSLAFTSPNQTSNKYGLVTLSGTLDVTDALSLQGLLYYSNFSQRVLNGNALDAGPCTDTPGFLCTGPGSFLTDRGGNPIPDFLSGGPYSQLNQTALDTNGYGAALQATWTGEVLGRRNQLVGGLSFDGSITTFSARSLVGGLDAEHVWYGPGVTIAQADGSIAPVRLNATNAYGGLYLSDVLDITPRLSLTLSGRLNIAEVDLSDQLGTALSGNHGYTRFNPGIGLTYRFAPELSVYASYSEANRAPTPAELACADPLRPCSLANFFVGDPNLKQVVAHTFEAGLRGRVKPWAEATLDWNLGVFRTDLDDDILFVPSPNVIGFDYFQNVGQTRRQGVEAGLRLKSGRLAAWLDYAFTDATFRTSLTLDSSLNPGADANGQIQVRPGNQLPGVPRHRLKFGVSYDVTPSWTVAVTGIASSGQYLFGDEANLTPKTGSYVVLNVNTTYNVTRNVQLFGLVQNALNARYETYGTFSPTSSVFLAQAPAASNPRSLSPAPPIGGFAGVRVKF